MALSQFHTAMPKAVTAILAASEAFRYVRDTTGDLNWHDLERAQDSLRPAYEYSMAALEEGMKAPEASESFMKSVGGPETLAAFHAALQNFVVATTAWNDFLKTYLFGLPQNCLIGLVRRDLNAVTGTWHIEKPGFIAAQDAVALRTSESLSGLVIAFQAVGA